MPSPSPIAYNAGPPSPSMFKKKRSSSSLSPMSSAASYLAAVSQADARARSHNGSPTSTPALSLSSTFTGSSEDTVLKEYDSEADGPLNLPRVPPNSEQVFSTVHSEFGHCANEEYRYTSAHRQGTEVGLPIEKEPPYYIVLTTYCGYLILICLGHLRDFFGKRFYASYYTHLTPHDVSVFSFYWLYESEEYVPARLLYFLLYQISVLITFSPAGICAVKLRFRLFLYPSAESSHGRLFLSTDHGCAWTHSCSFGPRIRRLQPNVQIHRRSHAWTEHFIVQLSRVRASTRRMR